MLSKKRREKAERQARQNHVNDRSLDGKGYFMDAGSEADAQKYVETGEERFLLYLPDYRGMRNR